MAKTISIYISENNAAELAARGDNRSQVVNRDLDRLYSMYKRALIEINLTVEEAGLIADALNGTIFDVNTARLLYASVEDAIAMNDADQKWGVDGKALVEKLKSLPISHCLAIIDAVERYWENSGDGDIKKIFMIK